MNDLKDYYKPLFYLDGELLTDVMSITLEPTVSESIPTIIMFKDGTWFKAMLVGLKHYDCKMRFTLKSITY